MTPTQVQINGSPKIHLHIFLNQKHFGITKAFHWGYVPRMINQFLICQRTCSVSPLLSIMLYLFVAPRWLSEINLRPAVLTEQRPRRVESSCVFPGDKGHFTSSDAIISRLHKGRTELAEVKRIYMGMMTAEKESLANCQLSVTTRILPTSN